MLSDNERVSIARHVTEHHYIWYNKTYNLVVSSSIVLGLGLVAVVVVVVVVVVVALVVVVVVLVVVLVVVVVP